MPKYKVSYKVLSQSATDIKEVAKMLADYSIQISQVSGKLGDDELLEQVRQNLKKLSTQLEESQAIMEMAGEILASSVENYTKNEDKTVKRVDECKCHQRDFYKQPVAVASPGPAGAASPASTTTTVNYTEANTVNYTAAPAATPVAAPVAAPVDIPVATPVSVEPAVVASAATTSGIGGAVAAGVGGLAAGAAAAVGAKVLIDKNKENPKSPAETGDEKLAALEAELKAAKNRASRT